MGIKVSDPKGFNEAGSAMLRNQLLIFSRWCQVMLRFEKELYGNPNQDLNKLWWDLVEKYLVRSGKVVGSIAVVIVVLAIGIWLWKRNARKRD